MKIAKTICFSVLLATNSLGFSNSNAGPAIQSKQTPESFLRVAEQIRKEMESDGRYQTIDEAKKRDVEIQLQTISDLLVGVESTDALAKDERIRLINAQEAINALLLQYDDQRLVCERSHNVGSHFKKSKCLTVGERRKMRNATQDDIARQRKSSLSNPGN